MLASEEALWLHLTNVVIRVRDLLLANLLNWLGPMIFVVVSVEVWSGILLHIEILVRFVNRFPASLLEVNRMHARQGSRVIAVMDLYVDMDLLMARNLWLGHAETRTFWYVRLLSRGPPDVYRYGERLGAARVCNWEVVQPLLKGATDDRNLPFEVADRRLLIAEISRVLTFCNQFALPVTSM